MGAEIDLAENPGPALLALYGQALPQVYGYLVRRCGQRSLAEDLTSATFLAAVHAIRQGDQPTLSTAWLVAVARNKLVDHWRRSAREEQGLAGPRRPGSAVFSRGGRSAVFPSAEPPAP